MGTTPSDTRPENEPEPENGSGSTGESEESASSGTEGSADTAAAAQSRASGQSPATVPRTTAATWSAEAWSIVSILFGGTALIGSRLVEIFAVVTSAGSQLAVYTRIILGDGIAALLGLIFAVLALATARADTRPWARWLAVGGLVVSVAAVIVAAVSFGLRPEPQPQPQPPGAG